MTATPIVDSAAFEGRYLRVHKRFTLIDSGIFSEVSMEDPTMPVKDLK